MKKNKQQIKSHSRIFADIYRKMQAGNLPDKFRVNDVQDVLRRSTPFLSKHSIDPKDNKKKADGNPYFIRVGVGLYKINTEYDWIF